MPTVKEVTLCQQEASTQTPCCHLLPPPEETVLSGSDLPGTSPSLPPPPGQEIPTGSCSSTSSLSSQSASKESTGSREPSSVTKSQDRFRKFFLTSQISKKDAWKELVKLPMIYVLVSELCKEQALSCVRCGKGQSDSHSGAKRPRSVMDGSPAPDGIDDVRSKPSMLHSISDEEGTTLHDHGRLEQEDQIPSGPRLSQPHLLELIKQGAIRAALTRADTAPVYSEDDGSTST